MGGTGIIDQFLATFTQYIDSGFGLLGGEVGYLATTLAAIDVTLAGLFWAWGADEDILARLVRKTLFVGVFAFLIGNWNTLARVIFESFAGLGLKASGTGLSSADFLRPGKIAQVGLDAGRPLLESIWSMMGYVGIVENFAQIAILLFAWIVVLLAFFILAIQLFITLIEFKLTTLAGFVLIPFGLFGKTAFAAERVLGNVISSGDQGSGASRHRRHRIDAVCAIHSGIRWQSADDRSSHGAGAGSAFPSRPRYFRTRYCQRHRVGRTTARRRRRGRHWPRRGWRHRRWRRSRGRWCRTGRWRAFGRRPRRCHGRKRNGKCLPGWRLEWCRERGRLCHCQPAAAHGCQISQVVHRLRKRPRPGRVA